jgi:hypothetical protein
MDPKNLTVFQYTLADAPQFSDNGVVVDITGLSSVEYIYPFDTSEKICLQKTKCGVKG